MILGAPVVRCYDLLVGLFRSAEAGTVKPSGYLVVDNGGGIRDSVAKDALPPNTVIHHPGRNLGVAASWNWLIEHSPGDVIISNDDLKVAPDTFEAMLACPEPVVSAIAREGYALFLHRKVALEKIGWFDENFHPAYFEDNDYERRLRLAGLVRGVSRKTAVVHYGSSTLKRATDAEKKIHHENFRGNEAYFKTKWGGMPRSETFDTPFDGKAPEGWKLRK